MKTLTCWMDNTLAWRLGKIALDVGARQNIGDLIDRGLTLRRLLEEAGFGLIIIEPEKSPTYQGQESKPL